MDGSLVTALGLSLEVWLFLSLLACVTLFFKFSRFWSVRNLDLLLLFALVPGMLMIVGNPKHPAWAAFIWLFLGSGLWLFRCVLDLGLSRRPLLEPNLNASGLLCLSVGLLGLLLSETVSLPVEEGAARNPAEPSGRDNRPSLTPGKENAAVKKVIQNSPLPPMLKKQQPQVIVQRVLASLAHLGLVVGLLAIGWRHFERPITGMAMAACYLLLPYTRMALVDSGQLIAAALIVGAVFWHLRPALAGALIGVAAGWIPACLGLIALWLGFYRGRGAFALSRRGCRRRDGLCTSGALCTRLARLGPGPGRAEHRGSRSVAPVRAPILSEFLGQHGFELPAPCADRLPGGRDLVDDRVGRERSRRVDRPVRSLVDG